ncbi:uncharacterized protein [Dysidea avara]|uniref:uncharacterized protein isoform X2 n=1 Tax=Dysidea avara TaxID=196820 RepID=UPI003317F132
MILLSYAMLLSSIYGIVVVVDGRSSGAPPDACETGTDIVPDHGASPSTDPLPFSVDLSGFKGNLYNAGQTYNITMFGGERNTDFRGFMIQGRIVADDSPTGTFTLSGTNYQAQCRNNTAATHTNGNVKTSVILSWTAPPIGTGAIRFRFAFVDSYSDYWANLFTATISEGRFPHIDEGPFTPRPQSVDPGNKTVKIGSPVYIIDGFDLTIICATVNGTLPITVRWFHNGVLNSSWINASVISLPNIGLNMNGDSYTCRADNDVGYDEHTTTINVFDPSQILPSLLATPEPGQVVVSIGIHTEATVNTGATVFVYCNVTGVDTPTIEWFKDVILISNSTNFNISSTSSDSYIIEVLTIDSFQPRDAGIYQCVATNIAGADSGNITLLSECPVCHIPAVETLNPNPDECPICGIWSTSEECICRSDVQICSVACVDSNHDNVTVDNMFCNSFTRPEQEESSGMDQCDDSGWRTGPWSRCCQGGSQIREVECVRRGMIVPDSECDENIRPVFLRPCTDNLCTYIIASPVASTAAINTGTIIPIVSIPVNTHAVITTSSMTSPTDTTASSFTSTAVIKTGTIIPIVSIPVTTHAVITMTSLTSPTDTTVSSVTSTTAKEMGTIIPIVSVVSTPVTTTLLTTSLTSTHTSYTDTTASSVTSTTAIKTGTIVPIVTPVTTHTVITMTSPTSPTDTTVSSVTSTTAIEIGTIIPIVSLVSTAVTTTSPMTSLTPTHTSYTVSSVTSTTAIETGTIISVSTPAVITTSSMTSLLPISTSYPVYNLMIQFSKTEFDGSEASGAILVTINLVGGVAFNDFNFSIITSPISAKAGDDYDDAPLNVRFKAGITTVNVTIPVVNDTVVDEDDEVFILTLKIIPETRITVRLGSLTTARAVIHDSTMPQIIDHPVNVTIEINNDTTSVYFSCSAAGASTYYWQKRGGDNIPVNVQGEQSTILPLVNIKPTDGGEYRCVAVNEHGRNYSDYAKLSIRAHPPVANIMPLSVNATRGQRVTFSCSANGVGVGTFVYGWLLNGIPISGETSPNLIVTTLGDNTGNYQCTVRNTYNGFGRSPVATLILNQFCDRVTVHYTGFTIIWNEIRVGATVEVPCSGPGLQGTVRRRCKSGNEWEEQIFCFREEAMVLLNQSMNLVASVNELNETERIRKVEEIATMLAEFTTVQDQPVYATEINITVDIVSSLNSVTSPVVYRLSPTNMFFEEISTVIDNLVGTDQNTWQQLEQTSPETSQILVNSTEQFGRLLGETLNNETTRATIAKSNFVVKAQRLSNENIQAGEAYVFPDEQDNLTSFTGGDTQIMIPNSVLRHVMEQLPSNTTGFPITNTVLRDNSLQLPNPNNGTDAIMQISPTFSALLPVSVDVRDEQSIMMTFDVKNRSQMSDLSQTRSVSLQERTCVFYDHNILDVQLGRAGGWSREGVRLDKDNSNETRVTCFTTHLTSFAVLVTIHDRSPATEDKALSIISFIGCAISLVCLCLAIVILAYVILNTKDRINHLFIHLNLSIALALGLVVFLAGIETATEYRGTCIMVAALLQYFFTSAFCWMLCEGVMLYMMLVTVFGNKLNCRRFFFILGWGPAIPIVAISVGLAHEHYGNDDYCWIESEDGAIAAFIAPIVTIILINLVFLGITLKVIYTSRNNKNVSSNKDTVKELLKATIILLPVLGLTWIIGIFAVNENTQVFAWIFAILNSLQGVFIFVIHVLRNKQVAKTLKERYHFWRSGSMYSVYNRMRSGRSSSNTHTLEEKYSDMHTMERESTNNSTDEKKLKSQVETGFSSNASDESIRDEEPQAAILTFSSAEEGSTGLEKQECTDETKDKKSTVENENMKNESSIKEYSGFDEQVSTFKTVDTEVGNGNEDTTLIP